MHVKLLQLYLTLYYLIDCSPPGSYAHGDSPYETTGVGCQGIFPSQGSNSRLVKFCCSVTQSCLTLCGPMDCSTPGFHVFLYLFESLKFMSIESVMPSNHLIFFPPLLLLPSVFPSIKVFSRESILHIRGPKYWSFSFSISPSNEYSRLISLRISVWLDLLAVQGTLKSLLQHHSSKASILCHSAFFTVQLSHPSITAGKTIALTRWTFVGKVMSLLFNMLSRLVITFLPRSKHLLHTQ